MDGDSFGVCGVYFYGDRVSCQYDWFARSRRNSPNLNQQHFRRTRSVSDKIRELFNQNVTTVLITCLFIIYYLADLIKLWAHVVAVLFITIAVYVFVLRFRFLKRTVVDKNRHKISPHVAVTVWIRNIPQNIVDQRSIRAYFDVYHSDLAISKIHVQLDCGTLVKVDSWIFVLFCLFIFVGTIIESTTSIKRNVER